MLKVYLGYDPSEHGAYEVAGFSMRRRSTVPILVTPLSSAHPFYAREWRMREDGQRIDAIDGNPFSTDFSFARFLVPECEKFSGWALFADCDFLFLDDIGKLAALADPVYAVMVVKHRYVPKESVKMEGQVQTAYPRKNWSSLILWNCGHPANQTLTRGAVNQATGSYLHQFGWLEEELIGELPKQWNHLVDHDKAVLQPSALHYTSGGPWFKKYLDCGYSAEWLAELQDYRATMKGLYHEPSRDHAVRR